MSTHPYDRARRSEASRKGWKWRRALSTPTPYQLAHRRFDAAVAALDPAVVRLYACDVAEAVLPIYQAHVPDDARPLVAVQVGRRYAQWQATDEERLLVFRVLGLASDWADDWRHDNPPAYAALQACGFAIWKRVDDVARWTVHWASNAQDHTGEHLVTDLHAHSTALELLAALPSAE